MQGIKDCVRICFDDDRYYTPVEKVDLNHMGSHIHTMIDQKETIDQKKDLQYIVYGVELHKMRKVLTLRTPYLIKNQTDQSYKILLKD